MNIHSVLLILTARKQLVFIIPAIFMCLALFFSMLASPTYEAETAIIVNFENTDPLSRNIASNLFPLMLSTQIEIILSDRVAIKTVEMLKLDNYPEYREAWLSATNGIGDIRQWIASGLKKKLRVMPSRDSNIITLSYSSHEPDFSATVVNTFAQAYLDVALEIKVEPAKQYTNWFNNQLDNLRDRYRVGLKALTDYQIENGIVADYGQLDIETTKFADLARQLTVAQGQSVDSRSRKTDAINQSNAIHEVLSNPLISNLKSQLVRLENERATALRLLGQNHPNVTALDSQITTMKENIAVEIKQVSRLLESDSRINDTRVQELIEAMKIQKQKVLDLRKHFDYIAVLKHEIDNAGQAFELVNQGLSQVSLSSQQQVMDVSVLTWGVASYKPSSPRLLLNIIVSTILGFIFSVALVMIMELVKPVVRCKEDMYFELGSNFVLGEIPST